MALEGPIIVIEDDPNDTDVISTALTELGVKNNIVTFNLAKDALAYLWETKEKPLLILSDVRMPEMDGLTLLQSIYNAEYLKKKSIPFIFFTVLASTDIINRAYDLGVQGFYQKADNYTKLKDQLLSIVVYWKQCLHPNSELGEPL
jgi:CheY-like chemotaxis protein